MRDVVLILSRRFAREVERLTNDLAIGSTAVTRREQHAFLRTLLGDLEAEVDVPHHLRHAQIERPAHTSANRRLTSEIQS